MSAPDVAPPRLEAPPKVLAASTTLGLVYVAAVKELVRRRRLVFLGLAVAFPLILTLIWRIYGTDHLSPTQFFANVGGLIYLKALVYLVSLFFGIPTVYDEIEGRTLTYLTTRPLGRGAVYAGRLLAVQSVAGLLLAGSLALCFLLMVAGNLPALSLEFVKIYTNYFLVVLLAVFCYSAVFALMGTALRKPLVWGILYIFAWESTVSAAPIRLQMYTFEWHLRNLVVSRQDVQKSLLDFVSALLRVEFSMPAWGSLLLVVGATVALMLLGGWIFGRKEYLLS